jgi:hypothetical protein
MTVRRRAALLQEASVSGLTHSEPERASRTRPGRPHLLPLRPRTTAPVPRDLRIEGDANGLEGGVDADTAHADRQPAARLQEAAQPTSDGFVVIIETPRLTSADVKAIAQRFAARLLAEAEHEGILTAFPGKEVPPRGCNHRGHDRGKRSFPRWHPT